MKMMIGAVILVIVLSLTGCMYPEEMKEENKIDLGSQIQIVQDKVALFQKENGYMPIKNSDESIPRYEKYELDFEQLVPKYLDRIPPSAFAKGGRYIYLLVDAETKPKVRLLDLGVANKVGDVQQKVNAFWRDHKSLPLKNAGENDVGEIDAKKLKMKTPMVMSPYSRQNLPLLLTGDGRVIVDYAIDIYALMQQKKPMPSGDLREMLVEAGYFAPSHSLPYRNVGGEPVITE